MQQDRLLFTREPWQHLLHRLKWRLSGLVEPGALRPHFTNSLLHAHLRGDCGRTLVLLAIVRNLLPPRRRRHFFFPACFLSRTPGPVVSVSSRNSTPAASRARRHLCTVPCFGSEPRPSKPLMV